MIILKDISKVYKDCVAIDNCNLKFGNTGFYSIIGVSGSGKTTLLNILGMLDSPDKGKILFDNEEIVNSEERTNFRKKNIGYVFQDAPMLEQLTVKENILLPLNISGLQFDELYFDSIVKELQIQELMNRKANELSAGQKQRIAIARAIICKPKILLADEPTGNLDEQTTIDVFEILKRISNNILVIVVTHNSAMSKRYSDVIVELKFGKVVSQTIQNQSEPQIQQDNTCSTFDNQSLNKNSKTLYLSLANIKLKKKKLLKIIGVTVLTLLVSAVGLSFVNVSKNNNQNIEKYFLDTNLLTVKEDMNTNIEAFLASQYSSDKFFSDYSFLKDDSRIEEITENYDIIGIDIKGDSITRLKNASTINLDSYYENKFSSTKLIGEFLSDDLEIILSSTIAQLIFPDEEIANCVGKYVTISGNEYNESYKVVAINTNEDVSGKIKSFLTATAAKKILQTESKAKAEIELYTNNCYSIDNTSEDNNIYVKDSGKAILLPESTANSVDLICGTNILLDGEIIISESIINDFRTLFNLSENDDIQTVLSQRLLCVSNGYSYFTIVGIYKDSENELSCVIKDSDKRILNDIYPSSINVYVKSTEDIESVKAFVNGHNLSAEAPYLYFKDAVGAKMSSITYIFSFLVLFMILVAFFIINTFSKHNIIDATNDIGLLKAIGASNKDILKIYGFESIIIGGVCSVIATGLYPLTIYGFNVILEKGIINVMTSSLTINVLHMLLISLFGIVLYFVSSLPSILKSSKVDAIISMKKIG